MHYSRVSLSHQHSPCTMCTSLDCRLWTQGNYRTLAAERPHYLLGDTIEPHYWPLHITCRWEIQWWDITNITDQGTPASQLLLVVCHIFHYILKIRCQLCAFLLPYIVRDDHLWHFISFHLNQVWTIARRNNFLWVATFSFSRWHQLLTKGFFVTFGRHTFDILSLIVRPIPFWKLFRIQNRKERKKCHSFCFICIRYIILFYVVCINVFFFK